MKIKKLTLEDLEKSGDILAEIVESIAGKKEIAVKEIISILTKKKLIRKFVGLIVVDDEDNQIAEPEIAKIGLVELLKVLNDFFVGEGSLLKHGISDLMSSLKQKGM